MKAEVRRQPFEVSICDENQKALDEYREEVTEAEGGKSPATSCYVECREGQYFSVVVRIPEGVKRNCDWVVGVYINGKLIREMILDRSDTEVICSSIVHKEDGHILESSLRFTKLATTEAAHKVSIDQAGMKELGQIKVECSAGRMGSRSGRRDELVNKNVDPGVADEKKAKHLTGTVGIGESSKYKPAVTYNFTRFDNTNPNYRFIFHYRTKAILRLMNIIGDNHEPNLLDDSDGEGISRLAVKRKVTADLAVSRKAQRRDGAEGSTSEENAMLRRQLGRMQEQIRELNKAVSNRPDKKVIDLTIDSEDDAL